jgi:hypothetical protein
MAIYLISDNTPTPSASSTQNANPQTPPPRRTNRTAGLPSARASPYLSPGTVLLSNGSPMELKTPRKFLSDKAAVRRQTRSASHGMSPGTMDPPLQPICSPRTPTHAHPNRINSTKPLFPPQLGSRKSSSLLAPAEIIIGPKGEKRARDPARPTVQLLRVMNKCWTDDTNTQLRWTLKDGLLNGRSEELDRSGMWNSLGHAVGNVWPHLRRWIMLHTPSDDDTEWFTGTDRISFDDDEGCINDPGIARKHSSLEQVGFFSACPWFKRGFL